MCHVCVCHVCVCMYACMCACVYVCVWCVHACVWQTLNIFRRRKLQIVGVLAILRATNITYK